MGSTDTGDYFPEGYDRQSEAAFTEGMGGSQAMLGGGDRGPALPGMENLGADAVVEGGIEMASEIPEGMDFTPMSVPDKTVEFNVASSSEGKEKKEEECMRRDECDGLGVTLVVAACLLEKRVVFAIRTSRDLVDELVELTFVA